MYKTVLKFKKYFVCVAKHFLVMSHCSHEFLFMSLYVYSNIMSIHSSAGYLLFLLLVPNFLFVHVRLTVVPRDSFRCFYFENVLVCRRFF